MARSIIFPFGECWIQDVLAAICDHTQVKYDSQINELWKLYHFHTQFSPVDTPSSHFIPWLNSDFALHIAFLLSHENISYSFHRKSLLPIYLSTTQSFPALRPRSWPNIYIVLEIIQCIMWNKKARDFALLFCFGKHISISNLLWRSSKMGLVSIYFSEFHYCYKFKTILLSYKFYKIYNHGRDQV